MRIVYLPRRGWGKTDGDGAEYRRDSCRRERGVFFLLLVPERVEARRGKSEILGSMCMYRAQDERIVEYCFASDIRRKIQLFFVFPFLTFLPFLLSISLSLPRHLPNSSHSQNKK